jgi:hypothetical protein
MSLVGPSLHPITERMIAVNTHDSRRVAKTTNVGTGIGNDTFERSSCSATMYFRPWLRRSLEITTISQNPLVPDTARYDECCEYATQGPYNTVTNATLVQQLQVPVQVFERTTS